MRRYSRKGEAPPPRGVVARKFNHSDYKIIDQYSEAILAYKEIGKVKVDCKFRLSESQWGVLGRDEKPAGIMYMDLSFDQPRDCRLSKATVVITLEHEMDDIAGERRSRLLSDGLRITERYGPVEIYGPATSMLTKDMYKFTPHADAFGFGAGGLGKDAERTRIHTSKWSFTGHRSPGKDKQTGRIGEHYRVLKWELAENELESQASHGKVFQTAFAFEHEGSPFHMRVDIDGELKKISQQMKRMYKFGGKKDASTTTRINLGGKLAHGQKLDHWATQLPKRLFDANRERHPIEAPGKVPILYESWGQTAPTFQDPTEPTIENLTKPLLALLDTVSISPSEGTLLGSSDGSRSLSADGTKSEQDPGDKVTSQAGNNAAADVQIVKNSPAPFPPLSVLVNRLLANLMGLWGL